MFLKRVEKGAGSSPFAVDWKIVEPRRKMPEDWEAHLRVHNLTPVDEVALADGLPPAYSGNPPSLRYLLRTRYGDNLHTQFVSVLEPYGKAPLIQAVRLLSSQETAQGFSAAVEVLLADGRRDVLLVTENGGKLAAGGAALDGRVGWARFQGQTPVAQALIAGTALTAEPRQLTLPRAFVSGKITGWDDRNPAETILKVDASLPPAGLRGRYLIVENTERSDASYRIEATPAPGQLSIGCNSLAERFVDNQDYSKGIITNIKPGDTFRIPLSTAWQKP